MESTLAPRLYPKLSMLQVQSVIFSPPLPFSSLLLSLGVVSYTTPSLHCSNNKGENNNLNNTTDKCR